MLIGTTVYLEPIGNQTGYHNDIVETTVTKVGRKYFEVAEFRKKFCLEKMQDVSEYSPNWIVWVSKQDIEDYREVINFYNRFRNLFTHYNTPNLNLQQLRDIDKILNPTII